jgi:hypothetical protein
MKKIFVIIFATFSFIANNLYAANVAPLGFELNVATFAQVKKELEKSTTLVDKGINKFSGGRMLTSDGHGIGIDGLSEITFIFDKSDRLSGVLMSLPKGGIDNDNFKQKLAMLNAKYKLIEKRMPFVGDSYAKFRLGDSIVEMSAPHMSFDMTLNYLSNQLISDFTTQSEKERLENTKRQRNKL